MKGKSVSTVKEGERRGAQVHIKTIEEELHQTLEVTSNSTCIFCKEEGFQML